MTASPTRAFLARQAHARRGDLALAALAGGAQAGAAVLLLGVSGRFLAGAALAGLAGAQAVQAFNYLLPSAGLRGLAILRTVGRYGERLFSHRAALNALAALRPALFAGLAAGPPERSLALSSGEAAARLVENVDALETEFVRRPALWAAGAGCLAGVVGTGLASPWAAAWFLIGLAADLLAVRKLAERLTTRAAPARLRAAGDLKDSLAAYASAAAELHCFGLVARALTAVMAHDGALSASAQELRRAEANIDFVQAVIGSLVLTGVAAASAASPAPISALALLSALAGLETASGLLRAAQARGGYAQAIENLDAIIGPQVEHAPPPAPDSPLRLMGVVLPPGARAGITGPSGCGKTTLLETLVGLRAATDGRARVGDHSLAEMPAGWARSLFAYAPQDARLISGTVLENLRLGAPDASEAELWQALTDAQIGERVRRLPEGLNTWLGDGGEVFSGGERRRLSLARAYLRPAPWLVLDEPTEGLDGASEAAVVEALAERLARTGQGLILVSHRPAPMRLAVQRLDLAI